MVADEKRRWLREEIDFLKQNYGKIYVKKIIKKLRRTRPAVEHKANQLGLKSNLADYSHLPQFNKEIHRKVLPNSAYKLNPELAYILGVMFGDGTLSNKNTVRSSAKDKDFALNFKRNLEKWSKLKSRLYKTSNGKNDIWKVDMNSREANETLKKFMIKIGQIMLKAHHIHQIAFLEGLYDSEGNVQITKYKNIVIRFYNCNKKIVYLMIKILNSLKINPRLHSRILPSNKKFYTLTISMFKREIKGMKPILNQDFNKFKDLIHFSIKRKQKRMEKIMDRRPKLLLTS